MSAMTSNEGPNRYGSHTDPRPLKHKIVFWSIALGLPALALVYVYLRMTHG